MHSQCSEGTLQTLSNTAVLHRISLDTLVLQDPEISSSYECWTRPLHCARPWEIGLLSVVKGSGGIGGGLELIPLRQESTASNLTRLDMVPAS